MNELSCFYDENADCWVNNPRMSVRKSYLGLLGTVRNKSVLDIGCGCGFDMAELSALGASGTGLDISKHSLQIAKERLGGDFRWDLLHEDFFTYTTDNKYDIVIFSMVVMHYSDLDLVFKKLSQFLKPGGLLLLVTNNPYLVLLDYNLQYPSSGNSVSYMHQFVYNGKEIKLKKYLHPFMDYFTMSNKNLLKIEAFQELSNYSNETLFFNPTPRCGIPNFLTFLYKKS